MSFSQRIAVSAVLSFSVLVAGAATPGFAVELDRTPVTTTSLPTLNGSTTITVPPTPQKMLMIQPLPGEQNDSAVADNDDDAEYASLSAAVDAQAIPADASDELDCLAGAIYFESKGEPLSGQLAVADVIINRSKSGRFPSSICSVVKQPGQFSFVRGGRIPAIDTDRPAYRTAMAVAQVALGDSWDSPAPKALFFHAKRVSPGWGLKRVASIGHHVFYR